MALDDQRALAQQQLQQLQQELAEVDAQLAQVPAYIVGRPPRWMLAARAKRELLAARVRMREGELADLDLVAETMAARAEAQARAEAERAARRAQAVHNPVDDRRHPPAAAS